MILIVEDDPLARRALQSLLAANGHITKTVNSAEDALNQLQSSPPPMMVLIDIDLPGMSGLQLLQRLRQDYPTLPCTLMSADNHHDVSRAQDIRNIPFFPKPIDTRRLLDYLSGAPPSAF